MSLTKKDLTQIKGVVRETVDESVGSAVVTLSKYIDRRFNALEVRLVRLEQDVTELRRDMSELREDLHSLREDINAFNSNIVQHDVRFSLFGRRLKALERKIV